METLAFIGVWLAPPIVLSFVAIIGGKKSAFIQNLIALVVFLWISLLAGFRFQTGDDWAGYERYYDAIDIHLNILDGYLHSNPIMLQFEPGYYILSYLCKGMGFSYVAVNVLSVILFTFAVLNLRHKESLPMIMIVLVFVGLPQITLYYNQVRQALAIAMLLIALNTRSKLSFTVFSFFAVAFHASSIMFLFLSVIAKFKPKLSIKFYIISLASLPIVAFLVLYTNLDGYDLLRFFVPQNFLFKINIYQDEETGFGILRLLTISYITLISIFIFRSIHKLNTLSAQQCFIVRLSILCCLLVPYSAILFPNSYAFFNRSLVFAMIILSFCGSILHRYQMNSHSNAIILAPFYGLGFTSIIYYFVSLYLYEPVLVPYRSFIFL